MLACVLQSSTSYFLAFAAQSWASFTYARLAKGWTPLSPFPDALLSSGFEKFGTPRKGEILNCVQTPGRLNSKERFAADIWGKVGVEGNGWAQGLKN